MSSDEWSFEWIEDDESQWFPWDEYLLNSIFTIIANNNTYNFVGNDNAFTFIAKSVSEQL